MQRTRTRLLACAGTCKSPVSSRTPAASEASGATGSPEEGEEDTTSPESTCKVEVLATSSKLSETHDEDYEFYYNPDRPRPPKALPVATLALPVATMEDAEAFAVTADVPNSLRLPGAKAPPKGLRERLREMSIGGKENGLRRKRVGLPRRAKRSSDDNGATKTRRGSKLAVRLKLPSPRRLSSQLAILRLTDLTPDDVDDHDKTGNACVDCRHANAVVRTRLRRLIGSQQCETFVLFVVLLYGVLVLFDLGVHGLRIERWEKATFVLDLIFLSFFTAEVLLRLYAFGVLYIFNVLNLVDGAAIVVSFVVAVLEVSDVVETGWTKETDGSIREDDERTPIQKLAILTRFLRVFRLVSVMMRSMRVARDMVGSPLTADNFYGTFRYKPGAARWEPPSPAAAEEALSRVDSDKLRDLVSTAPEVVGLLTEDFSKVLDCVRSCDVNQDGTLEAAELRPFLSRALQRHDSKLGEAQATALFEALDVDHDGAISVSELYAAGACLRRLLQRLPALRRQLETHAKERLLEADGSLGQLARLRSLVELRWRWWTQERWRDDRELTILRRTRDARAHSRASQRASDSAAADTKDRYAFVPGPVEILSHTDGSGALLEARMGQIVAILAEAEDEVGELSQKLQEIEVGQPKAAFEHRAALGTYRTYLQALAKALPLAHCRVQPFANELPQPHHEGAPSPQLPRQKQQQQQQRLSWHALRPSEGVEPRVQKASAQMAIGFGLGALLRFVYLVAALGPCDSSGFSCWQLRRACEERWAPGFVEPVNATNASGAAIYVASLPEGEQCDDGNGPLRLFAMACVSPIIGCLTLLLAPRLVRDNADAIALQRLLSDPRVLLVMLQAITRAGLVTVSLTRFPVAVELYSVPKVGGALLTARLLECLFMPCAIILFVLMDCCVVTAPRMRCVLALALLLHMLVELFTVESSNLPTVEEAKDDVATQVARNIDFSLLVMMSGAIASTLRFPKSMTFIQLRTDLQELVLFDTARERRKQQRLAAEFEYESRVNDSFARAEWTARASRASISAGGSSWAPRCRPLAVGN